MMTQTKKPLFAGVLRKEIARNNGTTEPRAKGFSPGERQQVLEAMRDGRDSRERTLDHVVDRMLNELTW